MINHGSLKTFAQKRPFPTENNPYRPCFPLEIVLFFIPLVYVIVLSYLNDGRLLHQ